MRKAEASQIQITKAAQEAVAQQVLVLEPIFISQKFKAFQDITCPDGNSQVEVMKKI